MIIIFDVLTKSIEAGLLIERQSHSRMFI